MRKINIILKDITEYGGGERMCVHLANTLSQHYNVEVFSFFKKNHTLYYTLEKSVKVSYLSKFSVHNHVSKFLSRVLYRYYLSVKLHFVLRYEKTNSIVLLNDGFFIPLFKHKKLLYWRIWHLKAPKRKKLIFNQIDTLILLSHKELHKWSLWHKNIKIIPNFIPFIPNKVAKTDNHIVLSVGRLTRQKGFLRLIEIWKMIQKNNLYSNWKLIIVGSGELKSTLEEKITKNKLENIILKPFTKQIQKEYLNASIYVMSSYFEGFPMVLIEASSYALPIISFDINTGPSDIIENEKSGFLIKDGDLQEFASKVCLLMDDKKLRKTMGLNAKERIKNEFSKEAVMQKWENLL